MAVVIRQIMNKKLETLHKQLVTNQKKVNNSTRNERIKKLKRLKKNILDFRDEIRLALKKDFKKNPTEVDLTEIFPALRDPVGNHT